MAHYTRRVAGQEINRAETLRRRGKIIRKETQKHRGTFFLISQRLCVSARGSSFSSFSACRISDLNRRLSRCLIKYSFAGPGRLGGMNNFPSCFRRGPALHQMVQGQGVVNP